MRERERERERDRTKGGINTIHMYLYVVQKYAYMCHTILMHLMHFLNLTR